MAATAGCAWFRARDTVLDDSLAAIGLNASAETRGVVESEVMDFSDQLIMKVAQAMDELRNRVATPEARAATQAWKVSHANAALVTATNPNAFVALLDMVVLVTLGRMVIEDDWMESYGDTAQPVLEVYRELERDVWTLAREYLKPAQEQEFRDLIAAWRQANPDQRYVSMVRLRDFGRGRREVSVEARKRFDSIFDILYLDPLSNIDPAVKELEQARSTVNRILFQLHRSPNLLAWQAELLVYRLLRTPELKTLLKDIDRVTATLESSSETLRKLPDQISAERERLAQDLETHGPRLESLLAGVKGALSEGQSMAASVEGAARAIRELIPDDALDGIDEDVEPPGEGSGGGFDVTEYGASAAQIGSAADRVTELAGELRGLMSSSVWRERAEDVQLSAENIRGELTRLVWTIFSAVLALILVLAAAAAAFLVAARRVDRRREAQGGDSTFHGRAP